MRVPSGLKATDHTSSSCLDRVAASSPDAVSHRRMVPSFEIEAMCLPWLSASPGGEAKLDIFRGSEDVYKYAAMPIYSAHYDEIDDHMRQVGKVAELALGFGGAVGAFSSMGRGYGVVLPEASVKEIVAKWRVQNAWCVAFWHQLWEAAMHAFNDPGTWYHAGRVKYLFHPGLMRGTLICQLPDERWLVYPQFKHERIVIDDEETGRPLIRWHTSCVKGFGGGYGRVELWYGVLAENITQAIAASFLRRALTAIQLPVVLHTHDEIVLEVGEHAEILTTQTLKLAMEDLPEWADGLPLSVTVESGPFYTK